MVVSKYRGGSESLGRSDTLVPTAKGQRGNESRSKMARHAPDYFSGGCCNRAKVRVFSVVTGAFVALLQVKLHPRGPRGHQRASVTELGHVATVDIFVAYPGL